MLTNQTRRSRRVTRRDQRGAAAVEFALIMPLLFIIVFGILQYGLFFNDSLAVRQGVREGARLGVVADFSNDAASGNRHPCTATNKLDQIACKTSNRIDTLTGTHYVRVKAASWVKGEPLTVCAYVKTESTGLLSMPNNGWILSRTQMSIEKVDFTPLPTTTIGSYGGNLPTGTGNPTWPSNCA